MSLVQTSVDPVAKIKVIGVGGGGGNAVNTMITDYDIPGVDFMAFNTDAQALKLSQAPTTLQLGQELTKGLGVGGNADIGAKAAEESIDQITEYLDGADMVFITAGMGGGTGTGAAPVVAGIAKNNGALTVAVVTKPFDFEGSKKMEIAEEGIASLKDKVDTLVVVPNQRLLEIMDDSDKLSFMDAMKRVDSVLAESVNSISILLSQTGYINADFNDAKSIMQNAGTALMGIGRATGENRAEEAARQATESPLLDMSIEGATGVLFNISGSNVTMAETSLVSDLIKEAVDPSANIKFGIQMDPNAGDEITITLIATGFDQSKQTLTHQQLHTPTTSSKGPKPRVITSDDILESNSRPHEDDFAQYDNSDDEANEVISDDELDDTPSMDDSAYDERTSTSTSSSQNIQDDGDPLEVPAFLRRLRK
ncbi:cell division protein FtsZ [bacterium]|nr:cell division protein FtsZ [bacterium]